MTPPAAAGAISAPARRARVSAPPRRRSGRASVGGGAAAAENGRRRIHGRAAAAENGGLLILDRVLRGPAYIALVGVLLAGIVFFNVDLLKMNHGIAKTDIRAAQLKRENAIYTLLLAKLGSSERIQRVALERGLVLPQPGDVQYLRADRKDARLATRVMAAPQPVVQPAPQPVSQVSTPATVAPTTPAPAPTPQPAQGQQPTTLPTANSQPPTQTQTPPTTAQATPTGGASPNG